MELGEFEKMLEKTVKKEKAEMDMDKIHEIALLEKEEGEKPYICNDGKAFVEFTDNYRVYLEGWENGVVIPARELEIKETRKIN